MISIGWNVGCRLMQMRGALSHIKSESSCLVVIGAAEKCLLNSD